MLNVIEHDGLFATSDRMQGIAADLREQGADGADVSALSRIARILEKEKDPMPNDVLFMLQSPELCAKWVKRGWSIQTVKYREARYDWRMYRDTRTRDFGQEK